jgi:hypothetical protein
MSDGVGKRNDGRNASMHVQNKYCCDITVARSQLDNFNGPAPYNRWFCRLELGKLCASGTHDAVIYDAMTPLILIVSVVGMSKT